jgi:hypothetical protein
MDNQFEIGQVVTSTLRKAENVTILDKYYDDSNDCWYYQIEYNGEKKHVQGSFLKLVS